MGSILRLPVILSDNLASDIEIAKSIKLEKISEVAKRIGIDEEYIDQYGKNKAKNHSANADSFL